MLYKLIHISYAEKEVLLKNLKTVCNFHMLFKKRYVSVKIITKLSRKVAYVVPRRIKNIFKEEKNMLRSRRCKLTRHKQTDSLSNYAVCLTSLITLTNYLFKIFWSLICFFFFFINILLRIIEVNRSLRFKGLFELKNLKTEDY